MISVALALHCLSLNVYHEARGEPFIGQVAVAQVTVRRAKRDPAKVCEAVYSRGQFSWASGQLGLVKPDMMDPAWQRAGRAAALALRWGLGERLPDYSRGATHYHADYVKPYWARAKTQTAKIGRHIFWRAM